MFLKIPNIGTTEINEIPSDYNYGTDDYEDNFAINNVSNTNCIICDPANSIALCQYLCEDDPEFQAFLDFLYPDIDFWFFACNEMCETNAENLEIDFILYFYIKKGIIQKIENDELKLITENKVNYVYVLPNCDAIPYYNYPNIELEYKQEILGELIKEFNFRVSQLKENSSENNYQYELDNLMSRYQATKIYLETSIEKDKE